MAIEPANEARQSFSSSASIPTSWFYSSCHPCHPCHPCHLGLPGLRCRICGHRPGGLCCPCHPRRPCRAGRLRRSCFPDPRDALLVISVLVVILTHVVRDTLVALVVLSEPSTKTTRRPNMTKATRIHREDVDIDKNYEDDNSDNGPTRIALLYFASKLPCFTNF